MPGFVLWFTGLSGSGKSTLTTLVSAELRRRGHHVETLDGDEIRKNLSKGLGFSKDDRDANVRRLGFVARLIARSGGCAITAAISPYREVRDEVRRGIDRFCEVYCECPVSVLAKRDPKGLYEKALRGEIKNFTGVDDPYEAPIAPEVHLRTDEEQPAASAVRIVERLVELGFIGSVSVNTKACVGPYGGELLSCLVPATPSTTLEAPTTPVIDLDAQGELAVVGLALGWLSPLQGFMGSRDTHKVLREGHLERGLPWPAPLTLRANQPLAAPTALSLQNRAGESLGLLQVDEVWSSPDSDGFVAGRVKVSALPRWAAGCLQVADIRRELAGKAPCAVLPLSKPPTLADEYVARVALERGMRVVLLPILEPGANRRLVRACKALVENYFDRANISIEPVPAPPGLPANRAEFLAIFAQNLGAALLVLPEGVACTRSAFLRVAGTSMTVAVEEFPEAYFDEKVGSIVTLRSGPSSPSALTVANARTVRPEVLAEDRAAD